MSWNSFPNVFSAACCLTVSFISSLIAFFCLTFTELFTIVMAVVLNGLHVLLQIQKLVVLTQQIMIVMV